jgi:hypothetical protein
MSRDLSEVGTGVNLFKAGEVRGVARWFNNTSDVLSIDGLVRAQRLPGRHHRDPGVLHRRGRTAPLGLGDLAEATSAIRKAHRTLCQRLAETDPEERNLYATQMYAWKLKAWARLAGCYDEIRHAGPAFPPWAAGVHRPARLSAQMGGPCITLGGLPRRGLPRRGLPRAGY